MREQAGKEGTTEAKKYLLQIRQISGAIVRRKKELKNLRSSGMSLRPQNYSADRVQHSYSGQRSEKMAEWRADLQREIQEDIERLAKLRHEIVTKINGLSRPEYSEMLHSIYVEGKDLARTAEEMHYSYNYACTLHGRALKEFWRKHLKERKES